MLSILRKARLKDKEMRILMLGLDNAGKSTIVQRLLDEDVNKVAPTLGFIIKTIDFEGLVRFLGSSLNVNPGNANGMKSYRLNICRAKINLSPIAGIC